MNIVAKTLKYPVGKSNLHLYKTRVINLKYLKKILT